MRRDLHDHGLLALPERGGQSGLMFWRLGRGEDPGQRAERGRRTPGSLEDGVGRGRHRHARSDRVDRSRAVAHAGVDRRGGDGAPAHRHPQHGPRPGRLLPGHAGRWSWRLPHTGARAHGRRGGGGARAAGVPPRGPVAQPRAALLRLLHRTHVLVGRHRADRLRCGAREGLGAHRRHQRQRPRPARLTARRHEAARRRRLRPLRLLPARRGEDAADDRRHRAAGRRRPLRRRRARGRRVRHRGQVHPLRGGEAPRAGPPGRVRAAHHAVPVPSEAVRRATSGARLVAVYENNMGQMVDDVRCRSRAACPRGSSAG